MSIFDRFKRKQTTFDDVKRYVMHLDDHRRNLELSELVAAAYQGKKTIHGKPYTVTPRKVKEICTDCGERHE